MKKVSATKELSDATRINELADQIYRKLEKSNVTISDVGKILYRVKKTAFANAKL